MNHNRGCYRQPIATPYTNRISPTQRLGNVNTCIDHTHVINKDRNDIYDTKDMNYRLAMVYSPYQEWQNIYNGEKALEVGTIFAELDKPFLGYKCNKGVCTL